MMATGKRRSLHPGSGTSGTAGTGSSRLNFRPNLTQEDRGGTRPTADPSSVGLVLVTMILHVCKKSLLFDTRLKVAIYCAALFVVSLIADFISMPRTYFSRSDNVLNQYFVKWGWGWLLTVSVPWIVLTAHTLGCGRKSILLKHVARIIVATIAWDLWTKVFNYVETNIGRCLNTKDPSLQIKAACLQSGRFWSGFDISGHTFILIYSSLILAEEGSSLIGWEGIKDLIMKEEHSRTMPKEPNYGSLRNLSDEDLGTLKKAHRALTPYLRGLFIAMTLQQLLWDTMLVTTILYYHTMVEKFLGGMAAILTWFATYQWCYKTSKIGLPAPGVGLFKYNEVKIHKTSSVRSRRSTVNGTSRFMGMPIRTGYDNGDPVDTTWQSEPDPSTARV